MPVAENEYEFNVSIKISALLTIIHAFSLYRVKSSWADDVEGEDDGNDDILLALVILSNF
jgi:hypothetical protein